MVKGDLFYDGYFPVSVSVEEFATRSDQVVELV
jgi:hypothetical protein